MDDVRGIHPGPFAGFYDHVLVAPVPGSTVFWFA